MEFSACTHVISPELAKNIKALLGDDVDLWEVINEMATVDVSPDGKTILDVCPV